MVLIDKYIPDYMMLENTYFDIDISIICLDLFNSLKIIQIEWKYSIFLHEK